MFTIYLYFHNNNVIFCIANSRIKHFLEGKIWIIQEKKRTIR